MTAPWQLEQARQLVARGLSVIPILPPAGTGKPDDGKLPAIAWRELQDRRPTPTEIDEWFGSGPMNLAIVTGAISSIVAIDCDDKRALRWWTRHRPYTHWQTRTGKGFHLFYRHPGVPVGNRSRVETTDGRLALDCRGDGGYVIAPFSTHGTGAIYQEAGDWTMPRSGLPRFSPRWLERPKPTDRPSRPLQTTQTNVTERARMYLAAIPRPEIGQGSDRDTLYAACRLVRGFALNEADAAALLWEWAGGRSGWSYDWVQAKVAHALRYGTEPMGALLV